MAWVAGLGIAEQQPRDLLARRGAAGPQRRQPGILIRGVQVLLPRVCARQLREVIVEARDQRVHPRGPVLDLGKHGERVKCIFYAI